MTVFQFYILKKTTLREAKYPAYIRTGGGWWCCGPGSDGSNAKARKPLLATSSYRIGFSRVKEATQPVCVSPETEGTESCSACFRKQNGVRSQLRGTFAQSILAHSQFSVQDRQGVSNHVDNPFSSQENLLRAGNPECKDGSRCSLSRGPRLESEVRGGDRPLSSTQP